MKALIDQGREAYRRRAWAHAHASLATADRHGGLELDDLERLAIAAHLIGEHRDSERAWTNAYHGCLMVGSTRRAVRCAFWLSLGRLVQGNLPGGSDWAARARRLLAADDDCAEQGYLDYPSGRRACLDGDHTRALAILDRTAAIAVRHQDADLTALACLGQGRASIRLGGIAAGRGLLDSVVAAASAGRLSPIVAGDIYSGAIDASQETLDAGRLQAWTAAFARWCDSQPELVCYQGVCLLRRAEVGQLRGHWRRATMLAEHARLQLLHPAGQPGFGAACYRAAELYRLQGESEAAEDAYRRAGETGRDPQPGLALLRLAQGHIDAAAEAISNATTVAHDPISRLALLTAFVEIMLVAGDTRSASTAAEELMSHGSLIDTPMLHALAHHAVGAVLLSEGDARAALAALRAAHGYWRLVGAPYDTARTRLLIGRACRRLGDEENAATEIEAARQVFEHVGAEPDRATVEST